MVAADSVHVLAMSVWLGGLAALVLALPAATRALAAADRTRLLAACLRRFSPLALASVAALLASGIGQSVAQLEALGDLTGTAFGRALLVKAALLIGLVGSERSTCAEAGRGSSALRPAVARREPRGACCAARCARRWWCSWWCWA